MNLFSWRNQTLLLPQNRNENIVVQQTEKELLVYDLTTHKVCCLNETAGLVFKACSGEITYTDLKKKYKLSDEFIFLALDELKSFNLLKETSEYVSPFMGMKRRK